MNWYDMQFMSWYDDDDEITKKIILTPEEAKQIFDQIPGCNHRWKQYTGLNEVYDICEFCEIKRPDK
jgi:hypothetical protein